MMRNVIDAVELAGTLVEAASDPNGASRLPSRESSFPSDEKSSQKSRSALPQLASAQLVRLM